MKFTMKLLVIFFGMLMLEEAATADTLYRCMDSIGHIQRQLTPCVGTKEIAKGEISNGTGTGAGAKEIDKAELPNGPEMVSIPGKGYEIGKYLVTQGEWRTVMGSNPSICKDCGDKYPVEHVSWNDVQEFIQKLNAQTGKQYRLPTRFEWMYACYSGSQTKYCGGNDLNVVGWYIGNSNKQTHPVGQKQANGYGLYDMTGNVWQWMNDCDGSCQNHILCGGSWQDKPQDVLADIYAGIASTEQGSNVGFRLVRTLMPSNAAIPETLKEPEMVSIPGKDYEMGKYLVTQGDWKTVMGNSPSHFIVCGDNCPVEQVSWNDVQEFIKKLNSKTGKQYRLPTETEWMVACNGSGKTEYCGGNDLDSVGWYIGNSNKQTHPVGQKQANDFGLYDMTGNVWEWMSDCGDNCQWRMIRGGSWGNVPKLEHANIRNSAGPADRDFDTGFRLARTVAHTANAESFKDPEMVNIPGKNYEIGKFEVTQGEWKALMGNNPSYFRNCGDKCPVEQVSWIDTQEFIQKLNAKTGKQYRLPTEAEWEFACLGGNKSKYCGDNDLNAVAWTDGNSNNQTHPVGQKQANGFGLYDMSGNVGEWMSDCLEGMFCDRRMYRGGSWIADQKFARAGIRLPALATSHNGDIGFRLARTLP